MRLRRSWRLGLGLPHPQPGRGPRRHPVQPDDMSLGSPTAKVTVSNTPRPVARICAR